MLRAIQDILESKQEPFQPEITNKYKSIADLITIREVVGPGQGHLEQPTPDDLSNQPDVIMDEVAPISRPLPVKISQLSSSHNPMHFAF